MFPTDAEILADLEGGKVEEDKKIKIMKCLNEEDKKYIQENPLKSGIKEFKENCFILYFKERAHLEQFIKEKM